MLTRDRNIRPLQYLDDPGGCARDQAFFRAKPAYVERVKIRQIPVAGRSPRAPRRIYLRRQRAVGPGCRLRRRVVGH